VGSDDGESRVADEPGGNPWGEMPVPGKPDAVKAARPVWRGESRRNLRLNRNHAVRQTTCQQGARPLPYSEVGKAGHRAKGARGSTSHAAITLEPT
jgi:hypothetical protein